MSNINKWTGVYVNGKLDEVFDNPIDARYSIKGKMEYFQDDDTFTKIEIKSVKITTI